MNRKILAASATILAFVLLLATAAWACTPQTVITQLRPLSGPAGTALTIMGSTPTPVEIRWSSPDGQVLANASGRNFSVTVNIPADAKPGVYYLISKGRALETFQVTSKGQAPVAQNTQSDLWSGFDSQSTSFSTDTAPDASNPASRTVGMVLLGLGIVSSATAIAALGLKRARSTVSARR